MYIQSNMAVEQAQHLIAMSLGKMAVSRNQRGGANLHRSLLVATVLHKARTTIMMENFQTMMQQRRAQMEAQQQQRAEEEQQLAACPKVQQQQEASRVVVAQEDTENQENCPPQQHHDNNNNSSCVLTTSYNNNNNILTPLATSTSDNKTSPLQESTPDKSNCARCLKRRVTELGPADDVYDAKRLKYESDSELSHDTSSRADCALAADDDEEEEEEETPQEELAYPPRSQTPEPMQTDPVQITNLVHRFNSGLSGLLSQVATEQAQQQQQQCNSEQQFTSCCTQVMDSGIESLSRPCIALTV